MKTYEFETLIIGGGPSGAACGIELIKNKRDCCILDKSVFPREKVCGGLLPEKTLALLSELLNQYSLVDIKNKITVDTCQSLAFYKGTKFLFRTPLQTEFIISDRKIFDSFLIDYYKEQGGFIHEGIAIQKIDFEQSIVFLKDGTKYHYQYLIAADGVHSFVYSQTNLRPVHKVFFIERDIEAIDFDGKRDLSFYSYQNRALGWSFPKGDSFNIGLGFPKPQDKEALALTEHFFDAMKVSHIDNYPRKGALLPNSTILKKPYYRSNVLFVGDAGCFSEPLTGEGIYQALFSGQMAAKAILQDKSVVKGYTKYTKTLRQSKKIMLFFQTRFMQQNNFTLHKFEENPRRVADLVDYHIGKRNLQYHNLLSFYLSFHSRKKK